MANRSPQVFISYSHDSPTHIDRVRELADRLRADGIDANLDQYELAPSQGWPLWMQQQVEGADFVLMVCTKTYYHRVVNEEEPSKGLGGRWEGHLIYQLLYASGAIHEKFIPVLFHSSDAEFIPTPLQTTTHYQLDSGHGYERLYRRLTNQPRLHRPDLGPLKCLPSRERRWTGRPPLRCVDLPPAPELFVGRDKNIVEFKRLLGVLPAEGDQQTPDHRRFTVISGWPGVGKSAFVASLAEDRDIQASFPDGIFWVAFGQRKQTENKRSQLATTFLRWATALGDEASIQATTLDAAGEYLRNALRDRRTLIIVDDVWQSDEAAPLHNVVSGHNAVLLTTRLPEVAQLLVPISENRYTLAVLSEENALELLRALAPTAVQDHPETCRELVADLECLPLALHVAGRLLDQEAKLWGVEELLREIRDGARLLQELAPPNMAELAQETIPTVAALLEKSTQSLSPELRDRFAELGDFVPKPATFDLPAMGALWGVDYPRPIAAQLVNRGLLEALGQGRFQMHALLMTHARSLLMGD